MHHSFSRKQNLCRPRCHEMLHRLGELRCRRHTSSDMRALNRELIWLRDLHRKKVRFNMARKIIFNFSTTMCAVVHMMFFFINSPARCTKEIEKVVGTGGLISVGGDEILRLRERMRLMQRSSRLRGSRGGQMHKKGNSSTSHWEKRPCRTGSCRKCLLSLHLGMSESWYARRDWNEGQAEEMEGEKLAIAKRIKWK